MTFLLQKKTDNRSSLESGTQVCCLPRLKDADMFEKVQSLFTKLLPGLLNHAYVDILYHWEAMGQARSGMTCTEPTEKVPLSD